MENFKTVILAAGAGTRMKSNKAKVLHKVAGKTFLEHVIDSVKGSGSDEIAVIIGHQKDEVKKLLNPNIRTFVQDELLGTGHAVLQAQEFLDDNSVILILNGDAPLTSPETIKSIFQEHLNSGNAVTVLTAELKNPTGYGRIIKEDNELVKIVEEKDASPEEKLIQEVNSGVYCFNGDILKKSLKKIKPENNSKEYYLTDTIKIIKDLGLKVGTLKVDDADEIAAINSRKQLAEAAEIFKKRINLSLMDSGVTLIDPNNTYIDCTVQVGADTVIYPGVILEGSTIIGSDCQIGANSHIIDSDIADNVEIDNSTIKQSKIESGAVIGPYAYIRPDCYIGKKVKIGDFVEIKNSTIQQNTKIPHLIYVGDADIGENCNLGCGTICVNYNGKDKFRTTIEDDCFIGCNTNLVAPVTVKKGSFTAAGSTITEDVPEETFAIARAKQVNKEGYVNKLAYKN